MGVWRAYHQDPAVQSMGDTDYEMGWQENRVAEGCFRMSQTRKPKTFETWGRFRQLAQHDTGKNKKHPYTKFTIETPHIDQEQFSELCRNDGIRIRIKIEYLPYTQSQEENHKID